MKRTGHARRLLPLFLIAAMLLSGCGITEPPTTEPVSGSESGTTVPTTEPDPSYPGDRFYALARDDYLDKTTAGFLGQLAGFLSGNEFSQSSSGKCAVAMPDSKFEFLNGLYAKDPRVDKHIQHVTTGLWEVWFDDDFSVDVVNQYILSDMYRETSTVCQKYITDGWLSYDVWDMGGGQRKVGAYGLISRNNYLPQYAGNTEYGNWYSFLSEPYLGTDTLGMNAPGMPETAQMLAGKFASVTGDRDNVLWAQMFSAMIAGAYFEKDIPALIRESRKVFPDGSYPCQIVEDVFAFYEAYPDDWRSAYIAFEAKHYVAGDTHDADTDINCGFVLLDLLYGKGDFMETCRIGSLAGYDCESTCGIALAVLGVMNGMASLPQETNTLIWQDGEGILTNLVFTGRTDQGTWMIADGLPDRIRIADVIDKYRTNFESVLLEQGGAMDDAYYYIPKETLKSYQTVAIENGDFEEKDLSGFTVKGDVGLIPTATTGFSAAKLSGNSELSTVVSGLCAGETYALTAYIRTTDNASAFLYADGQAVSVRGTTGTPQYEAQSTVRRTLLFTAAKTTAEIGIRCIGGSGEYAVADSLLLFRVGETPAGTVTPDTDIAEDPLSLVIESDTEKEVFLKLRFENAAGSIVDLPLSLNGTAYATAALRKTAQTNGLESADTVYIPLVLKKGTNTLSASLGGKPVRIREAALVEFVTRY